MGRRLPETASSAVRFGRRNDHGRLAVIDIPHRRTCAADRAGHPWHRHRPLRLPGAGAGCSRCRPAAALSAPPEIPFDGTAINPDEPLAPLPDLGVAWPDFTSPLPPLPPLSPTEPATASIDGATAAGAAGPSAVAPAAPVVANADHGAAPVPSALAPAPAIDLASDTPPFLPAIDVERSGSTAVVVGGDVSGTGAAANVTIAEAMRYSVALEGFGDIADAAFRARFAGLSVLRARDRKPANGAQLNRRIQDDTQLLDRMLRNQGYYDSTLTSEVRRVGDRLVVAFNVVPGPRYAYSSVALPGLDVVGPVEVARLSPVFNITTGQAIIADALVKAQAALRAEMRETGYPFRRARPGNDHDRPRHPARRARTAGRTGRAPALRDARRRRSRLARQPPHPDDRALPPRRMVSSVRRRGFAPRADRDRARRIGQHHAQGRSRRPVGRTGRCDRAGTAAHDSGRDRLPAAAKVSAPK